jgi:hypothetical protein
MRPTKRSVATVEGEWFIENGEDGRSSGGLSEARHWGKRSPPASQVAARATDAETGRTRPDLAAG